MGSVPAIVTSGPIHYLLCVLLVCVSVGARRSTRVRQLALLLASWLFYLGWGVGFLSVLIGSSLMSYALGAALKRQLTVRRLWVGVAMNIALLVFFKYGTSLLAGEPGLGAMQQLVRPIGISFWTLQALSYLFDIYHEEELDPSPLEFCLYMAFWPTVVMGPISRISSLLPQFRQPLSPSPRDISMGLTRVLQGLFMKMVVAEILGAGWSPGAGVSAGFDRIGRAWGGLDVWFLVIGFSLQLYFDFAGYSNIVIGAARLIGIHLDENFDRPFLAPTPAAFWTRWHISLSSWFRDYMFLPLASMRRGRWWAYASLLLSMVVVGLWHEATATFVVWGAYHGLLLVSHRIGQQVKRSMPYRWPPTLGLALSWISTSCLVSLGWLFFRARSLRQALTMFAAVFKSGSYGDLSLPTPYYVLISAIVVSVVMYRAAELLLARWRAEYDERVCVLADPVTAARARKTGVGLNVVVIELIDFGAARTWWWLAPVMIVVGVFGGLAIRDLRPPPPRTPFMYTLF